MTDTGQQPERVKVTQPDREAAASFIRRDGATKVDTHVAAMYERGERDDQPLVQAFARHRLTALTEAGRAGVGDGAVREALKRCRDQFRYYEREHLAAGKIGKAGTNRTFAELADAALAAAPTPPATPTPDVERMRDILDVERYKVADALQTIQRALDGRRWLSEGGRGSYAYDDERYQQEFGAAIDEIGVALEPLRKIARDWSDCPTDPLRVSANRRAALSQKDGA